MPPAGGSGQQSVHVPPEIKRNRRSNAQSAYYFENFRIRQCCGEYTFPRKYIASFASYRKTVGLDLRARQCLMYLYAWSAIERAMHDLNPRSETDADLGATENAVEEGLLVEERRRRICDLLQERGRVTVVSLARRFATSTVTIRADLAALERAGALVRSHGGALLPREGFDQPLTVKETLHHAEKVRIARVAVSLIRDGETIILDSGTTTAEIAKQIREAPLQSINVITNALNVAMLLVSAPTVRLIMPGGILRRESNS